MSGRPVVHSVTEDDDGLRLDRFCAVRHPDVSRSRLAELIRNGLVLLDGNAARPSERVRAGNVVAVTIPPLADERLQPEALPLSILFEDDAVLVLDKPAGVVVHPGAGVRTGTLAAALLHYAPDLAGVGGEGRAGLVHRLDRGTSGLIVVARTAAAHRGLQSQFRARSVEKVYHAIVWGRPRLARAEIDLPVGRDPRRRARMSTRSPRGREAHSAFEVLSTAPGFALLAVRIATGRTHQVRVHLSAIGHPIVGDAEYGGLRANSVLEPRRRKVVRLVGRPLLHAVRLAFDHPRTGRRVVCQTPWPQDMREFWAGVGGVAP